MAFPAEILRTSTNIVKRSLDEINYTELMEAKKPLAAIGMQRLLGMGLTTAAVPYGAVKLGQTIYGMLVMNELMQLLKRLCSSLVQKFYYYSY